MTTLKFCELFLGCQGEGIHSGEQNIFIRLSGCNKKCVWKNGSCDTKFASFQAFDFEEKKVSEIYEEIKKLKCKSVIATGGEPIMQVEGLTELFTLLKKDKYKLNIETNGSIFSIDLVNLIDFWSISPKLPSSGNKTFEEDKKVVKYLISNLMTQKYQIKFVIDTTNIEKDLEDIKQTLSDINSPLNMNLIFQPEGLTEDLNEYANRYAKLAEYVCYNNHFDWLNKYEWKVLMQNHRVAWNNRRRM